MSMSIQVCIKNAYLKSPEKPRRAQDWGSFAPSLSPQAKGRAGGGVLLLLLPRLDR